MAMIAIATIFLVKESERRVSTLEIVRGSHESGLLQCLFSAVNTSIPAAYPETDFALYAAEALSSLCQVPAYKLELNKNNATNSIRPCAGCACASPVSKCNDYTSDYESLNIVVEAGGVTHILSALKQLSTETISDIITLYKV